MYCDKISFICLPCYLRKLSYQLLTSYHKFIARPTQWKQKKKVFKAVKTKYARQWIFNLWSKWNVHNCGPRWYEIKWIYDIEYQSHVSCWFSMIEDTLFALNFSTFFLVFGIRLSSVWRHNYFENVDLKTVFTMYCRYVHKHILKLLYYQFIVNNW